MKNCISMSRWRGWELSWERRIGLGWYWPSLMRLLGSLISVEKVTAILNLSLYDFDKKVFFIPFQWTPSLLKAKQRLLKKILIIIKLMLCLGSSNLEGLFNSPLFESMAVVTMEEIILWVHLQKVRQNYQIKSSTSN